MQVKKVSYREVMLSHFTQLKSSRAEGLNLDNLAPESTNLAIILQYTSE